MRPEGPPHAISGLGYHAASRGKQGETGRSLIRLKYELAMRKVFLAAVAVALASFAGCGGSMGTAPQTPPNTVDATVKIGASVTGHLALAMSTSFQPAQWDYQFFNNFPAASTPLGNLQPQHVRLQPVSQGVPQAADQSWDFSKLDAILDPVIAVGDKSPELQLATAPAWMDDSSGHLLAAHFSDFANYSRDVVSFYNTIT